MGLVIFFYSYARLRNMRRQFNCTGELCDCACAALATDGRLIALI